uniref:Uncharacterized protein n=1 Tax=Arundo donax TaxID=35708 RepID=A0A0A9ASG6_ARUDO
MLQLLALSLRATSISCTQAKNNNHLLGF